MILNKSDIFTSEDMNTLKTYSTELNVDINNIQPNVGKGKTLLHINKSGTDVGFILLSDLGFDKECPYSGKDYELTIAIYESQQQNGYTKKALLDFDDWIKNNIKHARILAVVNINSRYRQQIEHLFIYASYEKRVCYCERCIRTCTCPSPNENEWCKEI